MESADRESRRLDILSVKKEANLSAREVGEVGEVVTSRAFSFLVGLSSFMPKNHGLTLNAPKHLFWWQ